MTEDEKEDIDMYARVKLAHKVMDWDARVRRAEELEQQGIACAMCGGTGETRIRSSFGTIAGCAMAQDRPFLEKVIHKKLWIAKVIHA